MDSEALVKEARAWPGVEWDALSAGKVGELLDNMASAVEALQAENARLREEVMTETLDNPRAFPSVAIDERFGGMTLRDYIAASLVFDSELPTMDQAKALMGEDGPDWSVPLEAMQWWATATARYRYLLADAMLAERSRTTS